MADHVAAEVATATGNDYPQHLKTYRAFLALTKWGTISVAVILLLMATFLL